LHDNGNSFQETKLITNKGVSVDVFVNAVKLDDDRYLAFVLDISDRKKAEENIYKSLEREKELSEMKTRFISMVSHEFRTPLANIYSNAQLLDRFEEKWNKEKKARSLDRILNSVQVLNSMLDDVSLFGKKQSGKLQYNPTPVDFEGYISSLIDETLTNFNTKRHVRFEKDDNVGTIHTDKFLLHHIVTNLLSNALKYSSEGTEVLLRIDNSDREWINLTIQDHGKGIPEKELNKIFEPFYRASNIDNVSGTGLGMAIIKHCTDLLNGKLHIDSEIGIGTTVSINIPVSAKKPKANVHEA
jgi:signal transduction histidine kinase